MSDADHAATREARGRKVREAWVAYCLETGDTKPSHIAPWEELSEWDKEADRRIGDAVATALQRERDEAREALEAERYLHREEIAGLQKQIDYAAKYGERDHSMGQPQPRRPTIHEQLAAERERVARLQDAVAWHRAERVKHQVMRYINDAHGDVTQAQIAKMEDGYLETMPWGPMLQPGDLPDTNEGEDEMRWTTAL